MLSTTCTIVPADLRTIGQLCQQTCGTNRTKHSESHMSAGTNFSDGTKFTPRNFKLNNLKIFQCSKGCLHQWIVVFTSFLKLIW